MAVNVEQLYVKYGPMVLRRCRSLLKNEQAALDAMQDVFVKLLGRKNRLRDEGLSSFLYITATNTCLNIMRASRTRPVLLDDKWLTAMTDGEDLEGRITDRILLERVLADQKTSTVTMAMLHYRDGFTLEETASATAMSISGVRKRLRKLRAESLKLVEGGS